MESFMGIFKASLLQFWKPVSLLVLAEVLLVCTIVAPGRDQDMSLLRFQYLAAIGMLVVDMVSIGWVAIWHALKTGSSHKAIGRSVLWMLAFALGNLPLWISKHGTWSGGLL